ncbi:hypothetical protein TIFTF001_018314 [Ficus carica]|uniref:Uncharacterized protein n=1 Tax=Ficus carica TaxID=3494 RepID=A0AA88AVD1_FICCA|nr:hypothetical protein TIFTF001_018314 [Ficus carica]
MRYDVVLATNNRHPTSDEHKRRQSIFEHMRKAQACGDSSTLKDIELDAEGKFSDLIEFERKKQLVKFNWDRILENFRKFGEKRAGNGGDLPELEKKV